MQESKTWVIAVVALIIGAAAGYFYVQRDVETLSVQVTEAEDATEASAAELERVAGELEEAQSALSEAEQAAEASATEIEQLTTELEQRNARIEELEGQIEASQPSPAAPASPQ